MRGPVKILVPIVIALLLSVVLPGSSTRQGVGSRLKVTEVAAVAEEPSPQPRGGTITSSATTCEQLAEALEEKRLRLGEREELLSQREEHLLVVQSQIEDRIAQLRRLREEIEATIGQRNAQEERRLNKLAKVYEATPPEEAGRLLSGLNFKLAAQILLKMNDAKAGKLWAYVRPEQAVKISEELYGGIDRKEER